MLHLGPTDTNWCGRVMDRLDGVEVKDKDKKLAEMQRIKKKHFADWKIGDEKY